MECPNCKYKYGWISGYSVNIEGEKGDFYSLPIDMERPNGEEEKTLYACPNCGRTFIDII